MFTSQKQGRFDRHHLRCQTPEVIGVECLGGRPPSGPASSLEGGEVLVLRGRGDRNDESREAMLRFCANSVNEA